MFNVGGGEILVILLVALLVLGPDKLPGAARSAGRMMRQVRSVAQGFQDEVRAAIDDDDRARSGSSARTTADHLPRTDVHPEAGAGPALPPADATPPPDAPERTTFVDEGGWRTEGPTGSFS